MSDCKRVRLRGGEKVRMMERLQVSCRETRRGEVHIKLT
jgi:hypothetical protein